MGTDGCCHAHIGTPGVHTAVDASAPDTDGTAASDITAAGTTTAGTTAAGTTAACARGPTGGVATATSAELSGQRRRITVTTRPKTVTSEAS